MVAITISRQYGSGGRKIATEVAKSLNYQFFDKRLMATVATNMGISERELVDFSEEEYQSKGFFDRLFRRTNIVANISTSTRDTHGTEQQLVQKMDELGAVDLVRTSVRAAYERGNVVIVGRGGQHILQNELDVFHVRVIADIRTRQQRLVDFEGFKSYETHAIIAERDKANAEYHQRFYNTNLDDPTLYNLVINTGKWSVDEAAQLIVVAFKQFHANITAPA